MTWRPAGALEGSAIDTILVTVLDVVIFEISDTDAPTTRPNWIVVSSHLVIEAMMVFSG
jgi:hypothetical protein